MFRISKDARLKKNILEYLDNQSDFVFFNEMLLAFPHISMSTLQKKCHELSQMIQTAYPDESVQLTINKRNGLRLVRQSQNLETAIEQLITQEFPYQLAKRFVFVDTILSEDLCEDLNMSFSQLRRKTSLINDSINPYDLHVTVSHQVKIFGNEFMRRANLLFYISTTHRNFSTIPWIDNPERYIETGKVILEHLDLAYSQSVVQIFSRIAFINECAIESKRSILFHSDVDNLIQNINFPQKPDFLAHWETNDWYFFLLMIYCSGSSEFQLDFKENYLEELKELPVFERWISTFEQSFGRLSNQQLKIIHQELIRGHVAHHLLNIDYIFWDIHLDELTYNVKKFYPVFYQKFLKFWHTLEQISSEELSDYTRLRYLLIFQAVLPLQNFIPQINIYMDTSMMLPMESLIKNRIELFFKRSFDVQFINHLSGADFILTTSKSYYQDTIYHSRVLLFEPMLSNNDLDQMQKRFAALFQ